MVRLMQKERLGPPHKSPTLENQAIWIILAILAKTVILVIFEPGLTRRKKVPLRVLLASTRPSYIQIWWKLDPPEARQKIYWRGFATANPA